ncbi:recombinase family protein [Pseudomonas savastanoi]|uniref:Resolvase n=1 Tax=Pseudomonas savastanoi pv. savastanoi NCPPB 3335 TaxID=693985 RepID=A0ABC8B8N7_PSESS|nr:recombinase family protein [Pseudomonas savastanoi]ARD10451.1 resolvase [Pseudomonas savastanoi pv. savastanoi NCPPB 3335]
MFIRAYLRASTDDQDASRARDYLETFVSGYGKAIASGYMENASGSPADRPELIRLLKDARRGDVLLVESIDRLSRMDDQAWRSLQTAIDNRGIRNISVDLPTSHQGMTAQSGDEFTDRMLAAISYMMIDMMAAIARKDYQQRRLRQAQGIEKAKASGVYKGRPVDAELRNRVGELLAAGLGIRAVARHAACSTTTVMKVRDELAQR